MKLVICEKNHGHEYFNFLKTQAVHFSIIFIADTITTFVRLFPQGTEISYFSSFKERGIYSSPCTRTKYCIAFFIEDITILSHSVLLKYERKLHLKRPAGYEYYFSYHKKQFFHRSWPVYFKTKKDQLSPHILYINPYESLTSNLIVLPLFRQAASQKQQEGYSVEFYHYFDNALSLSKILLPSYRSNHFPLTEDSISLDEIEKHEIVQYLQRCNVYSLENVLAESKKLKFISVSDYLHISDYSLLFDTTQWKYPPIDKQLKNILLNLKQQYKYVAAFCFDAPEDGIFYDANQIKTFFSLCHKNQIGVINLSDYPYAMDIPNIHVSKIDTLFSIMEQIDLYVGTNIEAGHIAGLFQKHNIILKRNKNSKYDFPLSNSLTLIYPQNHINSIFFTLFEIIFKKLLKGRCYNPITKEQYLSSEIIYL